MDGGGSVLHRWVVVVYSDIKTRIAFGDINQDGLLDLISGDSDGGLHLYVKSSITSVQLPGTSDHEPDNYALYANYPNPFHLETFSLSSATLPSIM